jgi:hypothetical protein
MVQKVSIRFVSLSSGGEEILCACIFGCIQGLIDK